jgi:hypothetical protein
MDLTSRTTAAFVHVFFSLKKLTHSSFHPPRSSYNPQIPPLSQPSRFHPLMSACTTQTLNSTLPPGVVAFFPWDIVSSHHLESKLLEGRTHDLIFFSLPILGRDLDHEQVFLRSRVLRENKPPLWGQNPKGTPRCSLQVSWDKALPTPFPRRSRDLRALESCRTIAIHMQTGRNEDACPLWIAQS